ncbi:MAG: HAD hydrolase-like protein [candidate division SR1 bacterium]|nr:HAD hydrolase-like protein [candidate division SR1 bacterium]
MSKIKYIFRDFWGTVAKINIKKDGYFAKLIKMYDIPKDSLKKNLSLSMDKFRRGEISEKDHRKIFSQNVGLPIHKNISSLFHTPLNKYTTLYKSIIAFVKKLQKAGYICVILSDEWVPQSNQLRKAGWYNGFDDILLSCEIGLSKHDDKTNGTTKIFDYVLKRYKIKSGEAIFIDDVEKNCIVAQKLGIKTIFATKPTQVIKDLKKILNI